MATSSDYWKWLGNFLSNSDSMEVNQRFFYQNAKSLKLDKAKTMISVGAGDGQLDGYIVRECTPQLQHYIGIEPHKPSFQALTKAMGESTNLKVSLFDERAEEWRGPEEPVDVVLASHVLYNYHLPGRQAALRQFLSWLKPGGSLIIVLGYKHKAYADIAEEICHVKSFRFESMKEFLHKEGYCVHHYDQTDVHHQTFCNDDEMLKLNFRYLVQDFTDEQICELVRRFKEKYSAPIHHDTNKAGYFRVEKPVFSD